MEKEKLWNKTYIMLMGISLLSGTASQMVVPFIAKYALSLGAELTVASTIAGLMSLVSLFVCPFAGMLYDRINRKYLIVTSNLVNSVCLFCTAFTTDCTQLAIMRLITGIAFSLDLVGSMAFTSSFIPLSRLGEGMGYLSLSSVIASAVGPKIALSIVDTLGYDTMFKLAGIMTFIAGICRSLLPYKDVRKKEKRKIVFSDLFDVRLLYFMLIMTIFSSANSLVSTYMTIIAEVRNIDRISVFFTLYSVIMVFIQPVSGKMLDEKGVYKMLVPSTIFAALGLVTIGVGKTALVMAVAAVFKAFGQGIGVPAISSHCVKKLGNERAGVATSTFQIGQNLGNALIPILGSLVVKKYDYSTMFIGSGILLLIMNLVLIWMQKKDENEQIDSHE